LEHGHHVVVGEAQHAGSVHVHQHIACKTGMLLVTPGTHRRLHNMGTGTMILILRLSK
jgi:hypothetical protein